MQRVKQMFAAVSALLATGQGGREMPTPGLHLPPLGQGRSPKTRWRARGRVQRHHNPPGTKLAKKARQGRLGLTTRGY